MTEWHARRAAQKAPMRDPVPEKVSDAAAEFTALVWQVAEEIAEGRLQAERTAIDEAKQQLESEKVEAAAFADQLNQELEAAKGKGAELAAALETASAQVAALQSESNQERARADRAEAVREAPEDIDTLKEQINQVRADKDAEIARLVTVRNTTDGGFCNWRIGWTPPTCFSTPSGPTPSAPSLSAWHFVGNFLIGNPATKVTMMVRSGFSPLSLQSGVLI